MVTEQTVFVLAENALQKVVNHITDNQWDMLVPPSMTYGRGDMSLRALINYHVYDDIWVPDTLAGLTIAEVGDKYDGDLLGSDPKAAFARVMGAAITAVEALEGEDFDKTVNLTYGDFPVREYLKHITTFRGFRSYTLAKLIGSDATMEPALVSGLSDIVVPEIEVWRSMGVFGPAIEVSEDATPQTKLLALTGFLQA